MMEQRKVVFEQVTDEETQEIIIETMWATRSGENFELDNIPFFVKHISCGDLFAAEYNEIEGRYYYNQVIRHSGNTTLRIYFFNDTDFLPIQRQLADTYQCETAGYQKGNLLAVSIPEAVNYAPIRNFLLQGEENERWSFEESCLIHDY